MANFGEHIILIEKTFIFCFSTLKKNAPKYGKIINTPLSRAVKLGTIGCGKFEFSTPLMKTTLLNYFLAQGRAVFYCYPRVLKI